MKATDLLKAQHREAEALMARLDGPVGAMEAEAVVREFATVLGAHMMIEQEVFYPACAEAFGSRDVIRHPFEEHAEAAGELRTLLSMAGDDPGFLAQAKKVRDMVEHHMKEEETTLFAKADPIVGDKKLELLGAQMEARFDEAVEFGFEVTTAEDAVDMKDVDRVMGQYEPTGERIVPLAPGERRTRKTTPAAVRHAAANLSRAKVVGDRGGGRRKPSSGAEGVRKTREGWRREAATQQH